MTDRDRPKVLTDEQWEVLAPLIEACRPPHKTEHHDLRRTIEAIIWRHDNGAKWRQIPVELGPWWMAAQTFGRWSRLGVWERLCWRRRSGAAAWRPGWRSSTAPVSEPTTRPQVRPKRGNCSRARRA